jgi:hypothetical protein
MRLPLNTGQGEALRIFRNDCHKLRCRQDDAAIKRSLEVWRSLAMAARTIRENVPPCQERSTAFSFLSEIGNLCSEAIVEEASNGQ